VTPAVTRWVERLRRRLARAARIGAGLAAELADEQAYARHLEAHGLTHSPSEWRRFSDQHLARKFGQAKCC
jgi:hypothetical protein